MNDMQFITIMISSGGFILAVVVNVAVLFLKAGHIIGETKKTISNVENILSNEIKHLSENIDLKFQNRATIHDKDVENIRNEIDNIKNSCINKHAS